MPPERDQRQFDRAVAGPLQRLVMRRCIQLHCSYTLGVPELRFEWDERKDAENQRKHGVSFAEARTVFFDDRALLRDDPDENEERFILLGLSATLRTLVVCHCYRERDEVIRIISARKAHREERAEYERRWK